MITELGLSQFYQVKHLTDAYRNIEVKAVVSGMNPGRIYVDDADNIKAALIWVHGQSGYQLVGDAESKPFRSELRIYMQTHILPELMALQMTEVEIGVADDRWQNVLEHMAGPSELNYDTQHVFLMHVKDDRTDGDTCYTPSGVPILPAEGTRVLPIDKALLQQSVLNNLSFVTDKIRHFWGKADAFLEHGLGYVVVHEDEIVSICFSAFVEGSAHAIDIETLEGHRQRNYAALAAQAYMKQCHRVGIRPYWDCMPDNTGSIRLAQSIGLSLDFDYQVYWYTIQ
ncbi:GNAT family N-acetyltransferase [Paenibacillus barcinonensis]|uniref:GNAT family N-acetyltransferase n=1 Tax=Paenibacillus TaxID=44249 RepID=UPI001C1062F3|nr:MULTISPECIES: GNAT family N-acetyltransferase [Paenibacillus]MBU5356262.1 GNAT family N-acetyltransferase [Paenibacillus barcinonensis]MDM5279053.1 GNAT family N-acetyltransferase [Paenibacillus silvae]